MRKINRKGFTLVELLAVIVILGLLMAIAIPSITKYIVDSRKKTLIATIGSYRDVVVNSVNDGEYRFSNTNTTYYVHINNLELEKGGNSPFGDWVDAYVVVVGDSLWLIAKNQLGNGNRWEEIYALNQAILADPNLIFAGQRLAMPAK